MLIRKTVMKIQNSSTYHDRKMLIYWRKMRQKMKFLKYLPKTSEPRIKTCITQLEEIYEKTFKKSKMKINKDPELK